MKVKGGAVGEIQEAKEKANTSIEVGEDNQSQNSLQTKLVVFVLSFLMMLLPWLGAREIDSVKYYVLAMLGLSLSILISYLIFKVGLLRVLLLFAVSAALSSLSITFPPLIAVFVLIGIVIWIARIINILKLLVWAFLSLPFYGLIIPNAIWVREEVETQYLWAFVIFALVMAMRLAMTSTPWKAAIKLSFLIGTLPYLVFYLFFKKEDEGLD